MFITIICIIIFISVLLVLIILAQNPKGGGLSSQFGGGSTSNLMGVKRTSDLLEKLTWGLAIALVVLSLSTHAIDNTGSTDGPRSVNVERAQQDNSIVAPSAPLPQQAAPEDGGAAEIPDAGEIPTMIDTAN